MEVEIPKNTKIKWQEVQDENTYVLEIQAKLVKIVKFRTVIVDIPVVFCLLPAWCVRQCDGSLAVYTTSRSHL